MTGRGCDSTGSTEFETWLREDQNGVKLTLQGRRTMNSRCKRIKGVKERATGAQLGVVPEGYVARVHIMKYCLSP